jgi:inner membrane protein involved in colicin E2 resistance
MTKRIVAIVFIFFCTSLAWMILGGTIVARTDDFSARLKGRVTATWGAPQLQCTPQAAYSRTTMEMVERTIDGKRASERASRTVENAVTLDSSDVRVALHLEHRQKGLLWYSTYTVDFSGKYRFVNPIDTEELVSIRFKFPAERAIYDDFRVLVDGKPVPAHMGANLASVGVRLQGGQAVDYMVSYRSQGLQSWTYRFGSDVNQVRNFSLQLQTDFEAIDFPDNTLSPTEKGPMPGGWQLAWRYKNLLSGFDIGVSMPEKLQPGPVAGQINFFAPVSLFFFFFLIFIITTLRNIELHPMNYFFLVAAFFAFHLLLAYLVDHISILLAFCICSAVSILLVVSYLRLVVGMRFAAVEAAISQFVYLVLFSYAFFFKGFTGLSITIGAIVTLFVVMQMTGRIRWAEKFIRKPSHSLPSPIVL